MDEEYTWYALYTKSRAEKKVAIALSKKGIQNYLPLKKELHQWSDRKKWVEVPAISSYIFVYTKPEQYNQVFEVPGIVSYVSHLGKAVTIPDTQMQAMKKAIESKITFNIEHNTITKGEEITINSGPFTGIKGVIQKIQEDKKLYINISNIGYSMVVNLDDII